MNSPPCEKSRVLEWCFRFGVPAVAWTLVVAFFAFAGAVEPSCIVEPGVIEADKTPAAIARPELPISLPSATTHAPPTR